MSDIISYQFEGMCFALRIIVQCGAPPGEATVALLQKLQTELRGLIVSGRVVDEIPEVSLGMSAAELLAVAEVLRASALSFLSPDEAEERRRSIGFSS